MALRRPAWVVVFSDCVGMVGGNVVEQLEEPYGRLFQGPAGPRQSLRDRLRCYGNAGNYSEGFLSFAYSFRNPGYSGLRL